ncbi:MAG: glycosyltransferase family 2 protein [Salinivirgaceae bacterium]|jgi:glycosyltransferase involved in cell wall biosynthesis|nr:glycosyltransferase family 2 protein [Salinivirgaceae bacterium]
MTPISVVVITFNEEKNIERCLKSVQDVADDIVVLDSFSKDKTEEICKRYNARFLQHAFDGHIEQKNRAITHAKYPHILSLDADEALDERLKQEILAVKQNFSHDGYYFNRLTNYCGTWIRHCDWYPDKKLRLWDSRKGKWTGENPHDRYELEPGSKQKYLKGDLLHYSFYTIEQHMNTINKFSSITADMRYNRGQKFRYFKLFISPLWKFFRSYIIKGGFRDGFYGFVICKNSAHSTFLKQVKLYQKWHQTTK